MEFKEVLEAFRSLGGVADHVVCREGAFGRGLFVVDPNVSIHIHVPPHLLIPTASMLLDDENEIKVDEKGNHAKEIRSFYEKFHRHLGWGGGGYEATKNFYGALARLPQKMKALLHVLGFPEDLFEAQSDSALLGHYLKSRQIDINRIPTLMPVIEVINHSPNGKNYIIEDGIQFCGDFENELLANYNAHVDMFHFYRNYRFVSNTASLLSCDVSFDFPSIGRIYIARFDNVLNQARSLRMPQVKKTSNQLSLSFVELFNREGNAKDIFIDIMKSHDISMINACDIFDGLVAHNKQVLETLLIECDRAEGQIVEDLKLIARTHLNILNQSQGFSA